MEIIQGTENFDKFIKENKFVLVDFFANWCGPCKMMSPHLEDLALDGDYSDLKIIKVDVDSNEELAIRYKLYSIPALYFFKDGKIEEAYKAIGYHTLSELKELVNKVRG